jgi:hypothetical protein
LKKRDLVPIYTNQVSAKLGPTSAIGKGGVAVFSPVSDIDDRDDDEFNRVTIFRAYRY